MKPYAFSLVRQPLAANANAHPLDVLKMKSLLMALGHYEPPAWGLSEYPDPALFGALRQVQRQCGLTIDGMMSPGGETEQALLSSVTVGQADTAIRAAAKALQGMGRNGDAILAHLTPEETKWLNAVTDGASIHPATGLLEFWTDTKIPAQNTGQVAQASPQSQPTPPNWTRGSNKKGWDEKSDSRGHYPIKPGGREAPAPRLEDMTDEEQKKQEMERYLRQHRQRMLKESIGHPVP